MDRILKFLILLSLALVLTTGTIGYLMGDPKLMPPMKTVHFLMGIITSLAVMLVNGIVATYFIGTSRWCKEVCQTYALPDELWQRSDRNKRAAFPITLAGMLVFVGVVSFGAMADPGTGLNLPPLFGYFSWATVHLITALLGVAFFLYAARLQLACVRRNHIVIEEIMAAVSEIRVAKGLEDPQQDGAEAGGDTVAEDGEDETERNSGDATDQTFAKHSS